MSIELQKALSAAWEKDSATAVQRGRVDDAYELGFIAAWRAAKAPVTEQPVGLTTLPAQLGKEIYSELLKEAIIPYPPVDSKQWRVSRTTNRILRHVLHFWPSTPEREAQQPDDCSEEWLMALCNLLVTHVKANDPASRIATILRGYVRQPERESIDHEALRSAVSGAIANGSRDLYEVTDAVLAAVGPYLKGA